MPNWKKLITSGSSAELSGLKLTDLSAQNSEATSLMINSSGEVGTRELGSNAFNSTAFTSCTGTVTGTGANNRVATWNGTTSLDSSANFTYDGTTLTVESKTTIGSGHSNTGISSSIAGGISNNISTACGFIGGGSCNTLASGLSIIGGGRLNCIAGSISYNSILGGQCNRIEGSANGHHSIGGGCSNQIMTPNTGCEFNTISGGHGNSIMGPKSSTIGGGCSNYLSGIGATIAGGLSSLAWGDCSFIGGGFDNRTLCNYSIVVGGRHNYAYGNDSGILGGKFNKVCGDVSIISGGEQSCNTGCFNFIGGGFQNKIGDHTSGNGYSNKASIIVGGYSNCIDGGGSTNSCTGNFIGGGSYNSIKYSIRSSILGGYNNNVCHNCSQIIGSNLTSTAANYTFMNNVCVQGSTRTTSLVETSARRHKECITPLQDQIENIKKLEPVNFQWKEGKNQDIGFIAEEVKAVYPNLVSYEEDGEIHGVHYSKLTTVLVKALQQQQTQIDELRIELNILKNK